MDFASFTELDFQCRTKDHVGEVYIIFFVKSGVAIPFYVGQTSRFLGRMDDYFWASYAAPTDFRVGEAIQYFSRNHRVIIRHKLSPKPLADEAEIIRALESKGAPLLNVQHGLSYSYQVNSEESISAVRKAIHGYCEKALAVEYSGE